MSASSENIFDNLPALEPEATVPQDELDTYLSTQRELDVKDGLRWWQEHKHLYPHLYRRALDYLSIPGYFFLLFYLQWTGYWYIYNITATSIDVERTFSQGRLLLSHVRSCLSVQSMQAFLCIGVWSLMGYVKDKDVKAAAVLPEDWDSLWLYITFFIMISSYSATTSSTSHVSPSQVILHCLLSLYPWYGYGYTENLQPIPGKTSTLPSPTHSKRIPSRIRAEW